MQREADLLGEQYGGQGGEGSENQASSLINLPPSSVHKSPKDRSPFLPLI